MVNSKKYSVKLSEIAKDFSFTEFYIPENINEITVVRSDVSRPGLSLAGYFTDFEPSRIQIIGNMEHSYLYSLPEKDRATSLRNFFASDVIAVVVTRSLEAFPEMLEFAKEYKTPLYGTPEDTSDFMAALIAYLNVALAERQTTHGVLVEVYGEGILMIGASGIGKSETAAELIKRGHRLIADDSVVIKRVSAKALVGCSPENIQYLIELRGIGIVDIRRIYGMGAVKLTEKIDMVINLEAWEQGKCYSGTGDEDEYTEILGIKVPSITVPVRPGRNLAIIIEIAAMHNRQKKMGYPSAAVELEERIKKSISERNNNI